MAASEEIHVLDKRVRLLQAPQGFRTSLDSVMLAASCPAKAGEHVLDLGCGVGGAAFCVLERVAGVNVTGIDIQESFVALAVENITLNNQQGRAKFLCAEVSAFRSELRFDHVICNPPYQNAQERMPSPSADKEIALGQEIAVEDWIMAGFHNLKSGGSMTMIHRADNVDKIIQGLGRRFGAIEIIPLWPRAGEQAKRVIVRAVKDRKSPAIMQAGIVLHEKNGDYTPQAEAILRGDSTIV